MLHFIGFLFILIIAILLIGLSIIGGLVRSLFGFGRKKTAGQDYRRGGYSFGGNNQQNQQTSSRTNSNNEGNNPEEGEIHFKRKKIFTKDDGEYVDFEEVKE